MKYLVPALLGATLLTGMPSLAQAQANDPIASDAGAPISDGTTGAPIKTEIEAGTGSKQATVKVNLLWLGKPPKERNGVAVLNSRSLNLTVSTPWDGKGDATPASLDGFAGGTSAKFEYVIMRSARATAPTATARDITAEAVKICKGKADTEFERLKPGLGNQASPAYTAALAGLEKQRKEQKEACDAADPDDVIADHLPGREREFAAELFPGDTSAIGLHATIGYDKFSYVDPTTLSKGEDKKTGWGVGASFTNYFRKTPTALTITLDYEVAFEEQDEQIFCPFSAGPGPVTCVEDHAGPPTLDRSVKFGVNVRHRFADSKGKSRIAIAPGVTYDVTDDVWGLELPIYFIPGKDETLTGGFKVGYRSDKKDVTFGLFIGAAFGLWD